MIKQDEVYKIGRIGRAHGLHGEVNIQVSDDVFDRVDAEYLVIDIDGILVPFFMEEYRFRTDETVLVKFEGIDTQEQARQLTGADVFFPHNLADKEENVMPSVSSLEGFTIINANDNKVVGKIAFVDQQTINTLFELEDGTLIPASEELITDFNQQRRTITVQLPEGLLS